MTALKRSHRLPAADMTPEETGMARIAQRCIGEALDRSRAASIKLVSDDDDLPTVELPTQALRLIGEVLGALNQRQSVTVVSADREMSTIEAANYLDVFRPFVTREIQSGRLPHRMVGTHRRIPFDELHAYRERMRGERKEALERLADDARELGLDC